jgi:hypothetical protein
MMSGYREYPEEVRIHEAAREPLARLAARQQLLYPECEGAEVIFEVVAKQYNVEPLAVEEAAKQGVLYAVINDE